MTSRVYLIAIVGMLVSPIFSGPGAATEPETPVPSTESLNLVFSGNDQPARLELQVEIDGQPISSVWDDTFAKLHSFLDRDGNQTLDRTEAARLPSEFSLRQILWGQFTAYTGEAPAFEKLDVDSTGTIDRKELGRYYRGAGLGGILIGVGKPTATETLTDALLKVLDVNQDGVVADAEWRAAAESARKLDANDDELIGPGELVAKTAYPGALGSVLLKSYARAANPNVLADSLPFVVLPMPADSAEWIAALATSQNSMKPQLDSEAKLTAIRAAPSAEVWRVQLNSKSSGGISLSMTNETTPKTSGPALSNRAVQLDIRADEGKLWDQTNLARKRFLGLFMEGDRNSDGALDEQELVTPKSGQLKQVAAAADRDANGILDQSEFAGWLELQQQIAKGLVLLTILDHGTGLFELIDADHDGSISIREFRSTSTRLKGTQCLTETGFHRKSLPRQLIATISHGHPISIVALPIRSSPTWFQAMDRNRDGDISPKEWVGDLDIFRKSDADGDGLMTVDEVRKSPGK